MIFYVLWRHKKRLRTIFYGYQIDIKNNSVSPDSTSQTCRCDLMEVKCRRISDRSQRSSELLIAPLKWPASDLADPRIKVETAELRERLLLSTKSRAVGWGEPPRRWPAAAASQPASLNKHTAGRLQTRRLHSQLHYLTWKTWDSSFISARRFCLMKCTDLRGRRRARLKSWRSASCMGAMQPLLYSQTQLQWGSYAVSLQWITGN